MPRQAADYDKHYGPALATLAAKYGVDVVKDFEAHVTPAVQALLEEDAAEMHSKGGHEHANHIRESVANYNAWKASKGF